MSTTVTSLKLLAPCQAITLCTQWCRWVFATHKHGKEKKSWIHFPYFCSYSFFLLSHWDVEWKCLRNKKETRQKEANAWNDKYGQSAYKIPATICGELVRSWAFQNRTQKLAFQLVVRDLKLNFLRLFWAWYLRYEVFLPFPAIKTKIFHRKISKLIGDLNVWKRGQFELNLRIYW